MDKHPFSIALRRFGAPEADANGLLQVAAAFMKAVWQPGLLAHLVDGVTFRVLNLLDSRKGGRAIIHRLLRDRYQIFTNDPFNADRFAGTVKAWLIASKNRIIIP